jgi:copper chaperone CopZ
VVVGIKKTSHQIRSSRYKTKIFTDHKNLVYYEKTELKRHRPHNWAEQINSHTVEKMHIPRQSNKFKDRLSRLYPEKKVKSEIKLPFVNELSELNVEKIKEVKELHENRVRPGIKQTQIMFKKEGIVIRKLKDVITLVIRHCEVCQFQKTERKKK